MKPGARSAPSARQPLPPPSRALPPLLAAAVLLAGCELGDWGLGIGTGFHDSQLRGRYDGTFHLEWEDRRGHGWDRGPGSIRLVDRFGSSFDGEWIWHLGSRRLSGRVRSGRTSFDQVSFALETARGRDLAEALTDCRYLRGDRVFRGSVRGRSLQASRSVRLRCHDRHTGRSEDVALWISFQGRR